MCFPMSTPNSLDSLVAHLADLIHRGSALNTICQDAVERIHCGRCSASSSKDCCSTDLYVLRDRVVPHRGEGDQGKYKDSNWHNFQPISSRKESAESKISNLRSPSTSTIAPLLHGIEENVEVEKALASIRSLRLAPEEAIANYAEPLQSVLQACQDLSSGQSWDLFPIVVDNHVVGLLAASSSATAAFPETCKTTIEQALVLVAIALQNAELKNRLINSHERESKELLSEQQNRHAAQNLVLSLGEQSKSEQMVASRSTADSSSSGAKDQTIHSLVQSLAAFELPFAKQTTVPWFYTLLSATELMLWEEDLDSVFTYVSPQASSILGYFPEEMLGRRSTEFMTAEEAERVARIVKETNLHPRPYVRFENTLIHKDGYPVTLETFALPVFDANRVLQGYRGIDIDVSDRKYAETRLQEKEKQLQLHFVCQFYSLSQQRRFEGQFKRQAEQERVARLILQRIRQSLDIDAILNTAVQELRQLLNVDRVVVYQFCSDGGGIVNHEAVSQQRWSMLNQMIDDPCFNGKTATLYLQGKASAIAHVAEAQLVPCYRELLNQFDVKALLVLPLMQSVQVPAAEPKLWGLFIAHHCSEPRDWNSSEIELMRQVSDELAIAIQQAELYAQLLDLNENLESQVEQRTQQISELLNFEALQRRLTTTIRESLDENLIIAAAVESLKVTLGGHRCDCAIYDPTKGEMVIRYESTDEPPFFSGCASPFADYDDVLPKLKVGDCLQFCNRSSMTDWNSGSILACPILDNQTILGDLWLFRPVDQQFSNMEMQLAKQVADQCAIAIRQSRLFRSAESQVEELRKLNALKDDFLSTVSHELRTPMASIKIAVDLLELSLTQLLDSQAQRSPISEFAEERDLENGENPNPVDTESNDTSSNDTNSSVNASSMLELDAIPDLRDRVETETRLQQYLYILKHECKREINLIDDLLDLSRLDADTEPLFLNEMKLQTWIPHVTYLFNERFAQRQQTLTLDLPQDLPPLTTDFAYFERVLSELLQNAYKYTASHEKIQVQVRLVSPPEQRSEERPDTQQSEWFQLKVSNSGIEILPEECDRIFDKFYRIPNSDPWKNPGTGLGLALVHKLVEQIQGAIAVSTTPGWTHFTVKIPSLPQSISV